MNICKDRAFELLQRISFERIAGTDKELECANMLKEECEKVGVEAVIEEFEIDEELITINTSLTDELDIDSLDLVDLVMTVEDEFSIELPDEALEGMKTIGDLVKYIEEN